MSDTAMMAKWMFANVALIVITIVSTVDCSCGARSNRQEGTIQEENPKVIANRERGRQTKIESKNSEVTQSEEREEAENEVDRAAVESTGLSEEDLSREVRIEPNPAQTPLARDPSPFTVRQEIIDQARLQANRPLSFEAIHRLIRGDQTTFRAMACDRAADSNDERLIPILIDALSDESMHVGARYPADSGLWTTRRRCHDALLKVTGESFGFEWNEPQEQRRKAIERWRTWYLERWGR